MGRHLQAAFPPSLKLAPSLVVSWQEQNWWNKTASPHPTTVYHSKGQHNTIALVLLWTLHLSLPCSLYLEQALALTAILVPTHLSLSITAAQVRMQPGVRGIKGKRWMAGERGRGSQLAWTSLFNVIMSSVKTLLCWLCVAGWLERPDGIWCPFVEGLWRNGKGSIQNTPIWINLKRKRKKWMPNVQFWVAVISTILEPDLQHFFLICTPGSSSHEGFNVELCHVSSTLRWHHSNSMATCNVFFPPFFIIWVDFLLCVKLQNSYMDRWKITGAPVANVGGKQVKSHF